MKQHFFKSCVLLGLFLGTVVYAQTNGQYDGHVGINTETPKATLDVKASSGAISNEGIIIPNLAKDRIKAIATNEESTLVFSTDGTKTGDTNPKTKEITTKGFYYYEGTNDSGKWVRMTPKAQFYMPSIVLDVTAGATKTVDLYEEYKKQYDTDVKASSSTTGAKLKTFAKEDLDYFVTYYDGDVFENVSITAAGVLTYGIKTGATVTEKTYMNVVFQEK